ncbi:hypothetical protein APH_0499 [Anaplasma phagocytophilum str. HZ]|uniref:Uncharacterized protein n=1 Tax=Anaplasma phagocytophilum (strain HZ) TaxID=212042 RepID=Q2GKK5_ANAPZ|nr:hypothetical protein APH_0499 [Anaplasma phagocytophilum str. HZ]
MMFCTLAHISRMNEFLMLQIALRELHGVRNRASQ